MGGVFDSVVILFFGLIIIFFLHLSGPEKTVNKGMFARRYLRKMLI